MKEQFENWNPSWQTRETLDMAVQIVNEYQAEGYSLTNRGLYYQLVTRNIISNTDRDYKRLVYIVSRGRLAGIIPWNMIIDRTREVAKNDHWSSPRSILESAANSFQLDKWEGQENRIIVMCEKDALTGILLPVCQELDVPFTACKGYSSQSHLYRIGKEISRHEQNGQTPVILYFGDHDPSGLDMDRDIRERVGLFGNLDIEVRRLALTMDQIADYSPPPNPAKLTDSRAEAYIMEYGSESWELDALEPRVLGALVRDTVENYRDDELWDEKVSIEESMIERLQEVADEWED